MNLPTGCTRQERRRQADEARRAPTNARLVPLAEYIATHPDTEPPGESPDAA